ncbi:TonB-dependent receptor [Salinisphaera sp. PC39]|uniref:TonB-dependent receptor n=1 Tax=Salinisphaera sp. PC39 TaxID=1304156 RepID=UPI0033414211
MAGNGTSYADGIGRALTALVAALVMAVTPTPGDAQPDGSQSRPFDIPAQPLPDALGDFAQQSGLQVSAEASLTSDHRSSAVSGTFTPERALDLLLAGTGLQWHWSGNDTVVLQARPRADDALVLAPVRIESAAPSTGEERPYTTAGSSSHISRREIERNRGMSVGDIFQGTTGVLVAENRNSGGLNVNIRGMQGQGRVPVLVDGARQETTVYRGYAGVTSRSYIDPDLVGDIEIDKGPSMGPHGTGATGGVVSMQTLDADDIAKPGKTWGVRLRGGLIGNNTGSPAAPETPSGYGVARGGWGFLTNNTYRVDCITDVSLCSGEHDIANVYGPDETMDRPDTLDLKGHAASLAVTRRLPWADFVAAYARRKQGNYFAGENGPTPTLDLSERYDQGFYTEVHPRIDGASRFRGGEQIVNSNFDSESILLKSRFYPGDDHTLEFSYLRYDSDYGELMPSQLLWLGRVRQTEPSQVTVDTYTGRYQWQPADLDWADLELQIWHTDTESLNNAYSEEMIEFLGEQPGTEIYRRWGGNLTNTMQFPSLGDLQVEYGVAWQRERVRPEDGQITPTSPMRDGGRDETSAFTALKWTFVPTLTLDAGIRYTRFHAEDDKPIYIQDEDSPYCEDRNDDGDCDDLYNDNRDSGYAPIASLLWEPLDGLQLYVQYAEALRMPSLFESTSGFSVAATPDSDLQPEHAKNWEVGLNLLRSRPFTGNDVLRLKAAYFHNRTEDYLTRTIPNTWEDTSAGSNAGLFRMRNIDSVEFNGTELTVEYDTGWLFTKLGGTHYSDIETCHTGSYRRQRCTDYGIATSYVNNMIPPNWEANATLGLRLFSETLELGTRVNWMGERNRVPEYNNQTEVGLSFAQPIPWHEYTIVDAFVAWTPNDTVTVDFNLDNLTDEYYIDALSLGMVPAPGRTARLSTTLHF